METQNLWPDFPTREIRSPKAILNEQGQYLRERTNNILSASVVSSSVPNPERIQYNFFIVAPLLNGYRYNLLTISYDLVGSYPLYLSWRYEGESKKTIDNEDEFIKELGEIFNDQTTINIVSSLLSQSRSEQTSE